MSELQEIKVFTPNEAALITDRVMGLLTYHINRGGFYTLGAASYLDDPLAYPAIANAFNKLIRQHFYDVLGVAYRTLERHLQKPIGVFDNGIAYPGFHIFDAQCNGVMGNPHIDEPFTRVDFGELSWSDPFSFTLALALPAVGGGVDFWWDFTDKDIETFISEEALPEPQYSPYTVGNLYLHTGDTPHRIANPGDIAEGEVRITLQGHGIHVDGGALLYF